MVLIRLNLPAETTEGGELVTCHEDVCVTAALPAAPAPGQYVILAFSAAGVYGQLITRLDGTVKVEVNWYQLASPRGRFRVVARDAASVELASFDQVAPKAQSYEGGCTACLGGVLGDPD